MAQKRNTETKALIKVFFIKLLQEKGMDSLTVSDIARGAKINRGTFYLHYVDKYDLLTKLEDEAIQSITEILLYDSEDVDNDDPLEIIPYTTILNALYYLKEDFDFFKALVGDGGDPQFIEKFKSIVEQLIKIKVDNSEKLQMGNAGLPDDYANEILLSSIVSIILLWFKKDGKESPEEIAEMVSKAKQLSPYKLLE